MFLFFSSSLAAPIDPDSEEEQAPAESEGSKEDESSTDDQDPSQPPPPEPPLEESPPQKPSLDKESNTPADDMFDFLEAMEDFEDQEIDSKLRFTIHSQSQMYLSSSLMLGSRTTSSSSAWTPTVSFSNGFSYLLGAGLRLWDGPKNLMDEPWDIFRAEAEPSGALVGGAIVSYGHIMDPHITQPYELELGGYIGFYSVETEDLEEYNSPGFRDLLASNIGSAFTLTRRYLLSAQNVRSSINQWCVSGQTTIALQQQISLLTSITIGFSNDAFPSMFRYTLGLNLSY
ncbi:MAG: hypothetical protein CMK59_11040 [Proteobacteria bacterium]|nr:hypothetical protein [Pseudomonadota bacterium]